jgi:cytochrome c oxidase cbb3-type subunit 3
MRWHKHSPLRRPLIEVRCVSRLTLFLALMLTALFSMGAAAAQANLPKTDAGGPIAPTAALERGRTVYVLNACHFCHGIDLTGAAMGAADLMHSPIVGADRDGDLIGKIVLAGLPNLQTAMPKFADLTQQEIADLAAYIHYLRQQGRYKELIVSSEANAGNWQAGEQYFNGSGGCGRCHSTSGDLSGIGRKYDGRTLRSRLLNPGPATPVESVTPSVGLQTHLKLLENYTPANVEDLVAYLTRN